MPFIYVDILVASLFSEVHTTSNRMRKILVLNEHHFCYVQVIRFQMNIILFLLNAHHLHYNLDMVDFAAHRTIHAIKISFQNYILPGSVVLESRSSTIACQSEYSLRYFHLDRSSDSFAIHLLSSHTLLAAEKRFGEVGLNH